MFFLGCDLQAVCVCTGKTYVFCRAVSCFLLFRCRFVFVRHFFLLGNFVLEPCSVTLGVSFLVLNLFAFGLAILRRCLLIFWLFVPTSRKVSLG